MRAGPLSDDNVIKLLNQHFVPVYLSNEDCEAGRVPAAEKAQRDRIWREANAAGMSSGTVHVYLLQPGDGKVFSSMHVAEAAKTDKLVATLQKAIDRYDRPPLEKPIVTPRPQSRPPAHEKDDLVLHLYSRGDNRGSWREFPAEHWFVLERDQAAAFTAASPRVGQAWDVDTKSATRLLNYFYPQTENNDITTNLFQKRRLTATVISVSDGIARARLDGTLTMKHSFYPGREDNMTVNATLVGYVDFDADTRAVRTLRLTTRDAKYGKEGFVTVVQSVESR